MVQSVGRRVRRSQRLYRQRRIANAEKSTEQFRIHARPNPQAATPKLKDLGVTKTIPKAAEVQKASDLLAFRRAISGGLFRTPGRDVALATMGHRQCCGGRASRRGALRGVMPELQRRVSPRPLLQAPASAWVPCGSPAQSSLPITLRRRREGSERIPIVTTSLQGRARITL